MSNRYEITGTATDKWTLLEIQDAIKMAGATDVSARRAFGWNNQPHVATFSAASDGDAMAICEKAREYIGPGTIPILIPYPYK